MSVRPYALGINSYASNYVNQNPAYKSPVFAQSQWLNLSKKSVPTFLGGDPVLEFFNLTTNTKKKEEQIKGLTGTLDLLKSKDTKAHFRMIFNKIQRIKLRNLKEEAELILKDILKTLKEKGIPEAEGFLISLEKQIDERNSRLNKANEKERGKAKELVENFGASEEGNTKKRVRFNEKVTFDDDTTGNLHELSDADEIEKAKRFREMIKKKDTEELTKKRKAVEEADSAQPQNKKRCLSG